MTLTEYTPAIRSACKELAQQLMHGDIHSLRELERLKNQLGRTHHLPKLVKNADLVQFLDPEHPRYKELRLFLKTKAIRTASGVANIAVMWKSDIDIGDEKFFSCPAECVYCPQGKDSPKSYTGVEPTTRRAKRHNFDPYKQVESRLHQFEIIGHHPEKCELIIMGGTFTAMPESFRESFVKGCFDAMNKHISPTLADAQALNETAPHRCVGLTIETRADFCTPRIIDHMLSLGCTRVEVGVQSTSDAVLHAINRGHLSNANKQAFAFMRNAGLKITTHWMPGLTGLFGPVDLDAELATFQELFDDPAYRPDELKIYPTLVIPGTVLYERWKAGTYYPLTTAQMVDLLVRMKEIVPPYVRIKRIMRDISEHEVESGPATTNLRQLTVERMQREGKRCHCIRCREVGLQGIDPAGVTLVTRTYDASQGKELFLSYEDPVRNILVGFLRLRLDHTPVARVRELHVYGPQARIGKEGQYQHQGYGALLVAEAERIAREEGKNKISITSGVGVRQYYVEKLGYKTDGYYVSKYF